jgi:hypothetical protein
MRYEMTGQTAQLVTALVNLVELVIPLLRAPFTTFLGGGHGRGCSTPA